MIHFKAFISPVYCYQGDDEERNQKHLNRVLSFCELIGPSLSSGSVYLLTPTQWHDVFLPEVDHLCFCCLRLDVFFICIVGLIHGQTFIATQSLIGNL